MDKKRLRYCLNTLIGIANNTTCNQLHHKKNQFHKCDELCPAEYELGKIIDEVEQFIKDTLV